MNSQAAATTPRDFDEKAIGLRDVYDFIFDNRRLFIASIGACVLAALVYLLSASPVFVTSAGVLIDNIRAPEPGNPLSQSIMIVDQSRVDSQIEVVRSDRISSAVIESLGLRSHSELLSTGFGINDLFPWSWPIWSGPSENEESTRPDILNRQLAAEFASRLKVRRVGQSSVIEIAFSAGQPEVAAQIANAVAEAYLRELVQARSRLASQQGDWLSDRLEALRTKAFEATRAVDRFRIRGDASSNQDARAKLEELDSIAKSHRKVYEDFQQQYTQTLQRISYPEADARIISNAVPPLKKSAPRSSLILAFAVALGGIMATGYGLIRSANDLTVRSARQLQGLGLTCLGTVGNTDCQSWLSIWRLVQRVLGRRGKSQLESSSVSGALSVEATHASGNLSERLKSDIGKLRTSIVRLTTSEVAIRLGFVSFNAGEGVTTLARSVAYDYAQSGARTLLVNACEKSDQQAEVLSFADRRGPGAGSGNYLTIVAWSPKQHPAPFHGDAKEQYEYTVVDLPALSSSRQWKSLSNHIDEYVLVVEYGKTATDEVLEAAFQLSAVGRLLGVVLNKTPANIALRRPLPDRTQTSTIRRAS